MIRRYLAKRNNPWELLVIAGMIFVPGTMLLLARGTLIALVPVSRYGGGRSYLTAISAHGAHVFGGIAVLFSLFIVFVYFYARKTINRELQAGDERSIDSI